MKVIQCWHCKVKYIDAEEEICTDCAVFFMDEKMYNERYESDCLSRTVSWDEMNDLGFSLTQRKKDWWEY